TNSATYKAIATPTLAPLVILLSGSLSPATSLDEGYREMYNLKFDSAHRTFEQYQRERPADPLGPVSDAAAYLYSEFDRLKILQSEFFVDNSAFLHRRSGKPDPVAKREFEAALRHSGELADAILKQSPDDQTALFATVLRLG